MSEADRERIYWEYQERINDASRDLARVVEETERERQVARRRIADLERERDEKLAAMAP